MDNNQNTQLPNDPQQIKDQISQLQQHLSDLEQGQASHQDIQQAVSSNNNPVMGMVSQGLSKVASSDEAKQVIRDHVSKLQDHLSNIEK